MVSAPNNNTNGYTDIGIAKWSTEHVHAWLNDAGFGHIAEHIAFDQEIDGKVLLLLNESDLREPPLSLQRLGDIKKLAYAIRQLQSTIAVNPLDASLCGLSVSTSAIDPPTVPNGLHNVHQISQLSSSSKSDSGTRLFQMITREEWIKRVEAPDTKAKSMLKLGLAFCYCLASLLITAFVMVLVHDRVPDMKTYPPLPDLVLDNLPLIPWAFECCEMIAVAMAMIWFTVLFFHKERVVILRRMFSLVGTVFLLRCVTMLITSLSVPGVHLACRAKSYGDIRAKLVQAFNIWSKLGMSIQGVRTCGDYMFSGHTTVITLLNHFITEYTPHSWHALHTATWIMNFFGVFFILAGHEHYSIDVFIAFYISSRMFLYYHTYAYNHINLTTNDSRMRLWFPLGWFFEAGGVGRVTNEFDLPFPTHFGATENDDAKPDETELTMKSKFCAATDNGMFRENQARKSVSLIDLRCGDSPMFIDTSVASTDDKSVLKSDPMAPIYRADSMTSFAPMPMSNMMVVCRQPSNGWFSEDDSGVESASVVSTNEPSVALRQLFALHRNRRPRMAAFVGDRERVSKLVRGKVQKRAPLFTLGGSRRKSIQNDFRLPPLMANPRGNGAKTTRVVRRGTCRCHGKSVIGTMEDCDDLLSVPSSSSSSSESPSCIFSSQPRCNVAFSSTTRRRHSLYAKVYGHRISAVVEENPRSIVEGLDLDRSASYVEPCNSHPPLMPTSSLSVDFFTSDVDNTLNRFNSLCIEMQSDDQPFSDALMPTEDLCTQFSMMTTQPHSTGHSPFASPAPTDSWTMSTGPSASAHDLLTPNASDLRASLTFFFPKPSDSSFTG